MRQHIEASLDELCKQAPATAQAYMSEAVEAIDRKFGDGYAKSNPGLVAQFMQTSATDLNTSLMFLAIQKLTDAIENFDIEH